MPEVVSHQEPFADATPPFRLDVELHQLLLNSSSRPPVPPEPKRLSLPEPIFPQRPELLTKKGLVQPPQARKWSAKHIYRHMNGWLFPYMKSRVLRGEFHPITSYLFLEYKCNLDCWYCWAFNNKVKGMTEDIARLWKQASRGFRGGARSFE